LDTVVPDRITLNCLKAVQGFHLRTIDNRTNEQNGKSAKKKNGNVADQQSGLPARFARTPAGAHRKASAPLFFNVNN